jgi:hypothetical protein
VKITVRVVGEQPGMYTADWPGVPRIGERVELRDGRALEVRYVYWYIDPDEPSPYVILYP